MSAVTEEPNTSPTQGNEEAEEELTFKSFVKEAPRMLEMISIITNPAVDCADAPRELEIMLQRYLEEPNLLDPHLGDMVTPLMACVSKDHPRLHESCSVVYQLCSIRGHKTVVKFFPHQVTDFESAFHLLLETREKSQIESNELGGSTLWHTEYVVLVWLSMLVLIPFDLVTIDSTMAVGDTHSALISRLVDTCKAYLSSPGIDRVAASLVLGRLLVRPDMGHELKAFLDWGKEQLSVTGQTSPDQELEWLGILQSFARIFKHGKRGEVLPYTEGLVPFIAKLSNKGDSISPTLCTKVIQRIALLHLPPRVAAWRYQRGTRSLEANLQAVGNMAVAKPEESAEADEEEIEIPEILEDVLDLLLNSIKARDTLTRWSAAKGIGRISSRLPRALADEIVSGVLAVIEEEQSDNAWHGACLATAEMARRGVLLPSRLSDAIPILVKALSYERRRGNFSVGSHVRDSACYVAWAFARAYGAEILSPHVLDISRALLVTACYDREVNCRRAAAAAYQESVGRQGTFPHGIAIVQQADYFSLGNRGHAYLTVSLFIAQYDEYRVCCT